MFICTSYANNNKNTYDIKTANLLKYTMLHNHGNITAEDYEEIWSLTLPNAFQTTKYGMHVPCSLQSPHSKGIEMITSIWDLPREP